jgi:hypothetical protein
MKLIKNTFLLFILFIIGSAIIDIFVDDINVSMFFGLVLAIVIVFKPQKYLGKLGSVKKLFKSGIPDETIEQHRNLILEQFIAGDLAKHFSTDIFLKKGEKLIFDIPGIQICEEKTIKVKGSHSGYSVRIMKGLSYRFGDFESTAEKRVAALDTGHFIITTKRLIFSGGKKSLDIPLSKIVSAKPVDNGILIDRTAKQNVEYFLGLDNVQLDMTLVPEVQNGDTWKEQKVKFSLNGFDVRRIIQGVIQIAE